MLEDLRPGRWEALPQPASGALSAVRDAAGAVPHGAGRRAPGGARRRGRPQDRPGRAGRGARHRRPAAQGVRRAGSGEAAATSCGWPRWAPIGTRCCTPRRCAVGGLLRERLFGRSTVVLTSATLALGGNFDALARQWGLPPGATSAPSDDPVPDPGRPEVVGPGRRLAVRARQERHPLRRASRCPRPGRDGLPARLPRRDRRAGRGRGRPHARAVLVDARRQAGHRGAARPAGHTAALPGRRRHDAAGQAVRRGRRDVAVRHAVALAGRRRARALAARA